MMRHAISPTPLAAAGAMLLALSLTVSGAAAPAPEWSKPINGLVARLELSRGEPFEGVQIIKTRIFLKNVQTAASLLSIDWPHWKLTWHVEDAAGNVLAKANGPYDGESPIPQELVLPFQGELSFDITEHGAGVIPGKTFAMLDLGPENVWAIPHDGKTYYLKGSLEIAQQGNQPPHRHWFGKIDLPAVAIPTAPAAEKQR